MSAAPEPTTILVCAGRPVDDHGRPVGPPCGRTFKAPAAMVPEVPGDGSFPPWHLRRATEAETVQQARAAGWSIGSGLLGMCPRCRRPDPRVVADCRAIQASLPDPPTREVTGA